VTSTLLTQIDDALTAAAIVIGGAFAYLKFIKGRVLTAAVGYEIQAVVTAHAVARRHMPLQSFTGPSAGAIAVEVAIRNNGQIALTVPRDSQQSPMPTSPGRTSCSTTASRRRATWSSALGTCSRWARCSPSPAGITPPHTWLS